MFPTTISTYHHDVIIQFDVNNIWQTFSAHNKKQAMTHASTQTVYNTLSFSVCRILLFIVQTES